jgi:hypothetical protein
LISSQTPYSAIIALYHRGNWLLIMNFNINGIATFLICHQIPRYRKQTWSCSDMDKFLPTYRINFNKYIEIFANIYMSCNNLQDPHLLLVKCLKTICQLVGHFQVRCPNKVECWQTIGLMDTMISFQKHVLMDNITIFEKLFTICWLMSI